MKIRTVGDMIDALEDFDRDMPLHLAIQPNYPFAHSISDVQVVEVYDEPSNGRREVMYIADGGQLDYLNGAARDALGW